MTDKDRRIMPGIRVVKNSAPRFKQPVEKGYEFVLGRIVTYDLVQLPAEFMGRDLARRKGFHRRLNIRHQERGWQTFTGYISNAQGNPRLVEFQDIKIVS